MSAIGQQGGKKYSYGMTLPRVVDGLKRQMQANQPRPAARIRRLEQGEGRGGTGAKFVTAKGS